jgi:hypothetical protein
MSIRSALIVAALAALVAKNAHAAGPYDPAVEYLTVTTPHFLVVHPKGYEHIALRTAKIAEGLAPYMGARYGYELKDRTTIIINDQTDFANGSATVTPLKVITIFVTAPTEVSGLEDYDDWLHNVIVHELAHIYHLDMAYGLPWLGRFIFGKYVSMNVYTPAWVTEGLAVYEETVSSGAGRGRSSYVEMVLRMAALEDRFPSIDQGFRSFSNWPFSNVAYFIGGRFQLWIAEKYGEEALLHYHRANASSPIPYFTWLPAKIAFDTSLESLWLAFENEAKQDAALALHRVRTSTEGETVPKRLTRYGGDLLGPRVTPDGKSIVFSTFSPKDGARMRKMPIEGGEGEVLLDDTFSKAISFTPDGNAFFAQQTEINQRFYFHNSVLRYDLRDRSVRRISILEDDKKEFAAPSGSLRARDPEISPDGKRLVFVQTPYGANRLVLAWLESDGMTIHPKVIVPAEPDVQLSNPRFSPDGERIAVSRFRGGRRDIVLYDLEGQLLLELTRDRAQDIDPTWSKDGRWLLFASDRTGIYNLYGFDFETERLVRLTNLISGAYQPSLSPDMKTLVFRGYSADGFDVYSVEFAPENGTVVPIGREAAETFDAMPRRWPPASETLPELPPPAPFKDTPLPSTLPEGWDLGKYSAIDTLPPWHDNWNLLPVLAANEREIFGRLTHFGSDALDTQSYSVSVTYGTATRFVGGSVAYVNNQLEPTFAAIGDAEAVTFVVEDAAGDLQFYDQQRLTGALIISLPVRQRHVFSVGLIAEDRRPLRSLAEQGLEGSTTLPREGNFSRITLGYAYNNTRFFPHSVSAERGWSAAFALAGFTPGIGSDYEQVSLSSEVRGYWTVPWKHDLLRNHALAGRLGILLSDGPKRADTGRMGGVAGSSVLTTTTQSFYPLRGLRIASLSGSSLINGGLEYRAPIVRIEKGYGTLPALVRVLHLALFSDFGRILDPLSLDRFFDPFAVSVGAELRGDLLLGYLLELELRLGYAQLLATPDERFDASGPYFQIGSTF